MEDYEKINALEWDLKKREELKQQAAEDGFQLVSSKKQQKQPKPAVKLLPPPPQAPSNKGGTNSQSARKQQRQPAKAPTRVATTSGKTPKVCYPQPSLGRTGCSPNAYACPFYSVGDETSCETVSCLDISAWPGLADLQPNIHPHITQRPQHQP